MRPSRKPTLTACFVVACATILAACVADSTSPRLSRLGGPIALLSPASGGRFVQNDPSTGCQDHVARGHGFRVAFDWQDVEGATEYTIVFWHRGSPVPAVNQVVTSSHYTKTECNGFVADFNLDNWVWRVAAVGIVDGVPTDTLWSEERIYGFQPCRLGDGTSCWAPPE